MSTEKIQLPLDGHGMEAAFRKLLSRILTASSAKRLQIAEQLSVKAGMRISCSMLNAYCSLTSETARFPAALILPLAEIVQDDALQRHLMGPRLLALVEYAERELAGFRDQREREKLREKLLADGNIGHGSGGSSSGI